MPYISQDAFESVNVYFGENETITSEIAGFGTRIVTRRWNTYRRRNDYFVTVRRVKYEIHPDFAHTLDMLRAPDAYRGIFFPGLVVHTPNGSEAIVVANYGVWSPYPSARKAILRYRVNGIINGVDSYPVPHDRLSLDYSHAEWVNLDPNNEWMN